jgi:hypothetical protein
MFYRFMPSDLDRANAEYQRAGAIVKALEGDAERQREEINMHKKSLVNILMTLDQNRTTGETTWNKWYEAMFDSHSQLLAAHQARRDTLIHLAAQYRRLLAEAGCEILRGKDARDRGTPYPVAPRVQNLLAPVFAGR